MQLLGAIWSRTLQYRPKIFQIGIDTDPKVREKKRNGIKANKFCVGICTKKESEVFWNQALSWVRKTKVEKA